MFHLKRVKYCGAGLMFTFILLFQILKNTMGHRCYVCGKNDQPSCDNFLSTNTIFFKECEPNARSCGTQIYESGKFVRTCEQLNLDDCKTANNVKYCYCAKEMCNGELIEPTDDEDLLEGSGFVTNKPVTPKLSINVDSSNNNSSTKVFISQYLNHICLIITAAIKLFM